MGDERDVTRWPVDEASHLFAISFYSPFPSLSPIFDGEERVGKEEEVN